MEQEKINFQLFEYLSGHLSGEECREVEGWIDGSEENRVYFAGFRKNYIWSRWFFRSELLKRDYAHFERKIGRRYIRRLFFRVAAILVLLLCVGGGWLLLEYNKVESGGGLESSGGVQALLILSSGKQVKLDSLTDFSLQESGSHIRAGREGLNYQSDSCAGQLVPEHTILIPRGGFYHVTLSDGSQVWLNSKTEFRFPVSFPGNVRTVYVKGEAYFDVVRDTCRPFVVKTGSADVRVLGTKFNINNRDNNVTTVLEEGCVGVEWGEKCQLLEPGEKGVYMEDGSWIKDKVDTRLYVAWREGDFIFEEETLANIMEQLALWYDIDVFYTQESSKQIRISGDVRRYESIEKLFRYFEKVSGVHFSMKGKTVIVK